MKISARTVMLFAAVTCLAVIAVFFGWWLFQPEQESARAIFAIVCAFIALGLVAWSSRWQPPKGRNE